MSEVIRQSELCCPYCGYKETLIMPTDACLWFHECRHCHTLLQPLQGDCCLFCSYGTVSCPPIQQDKTCNVMQGDVCESD